MKVVFCCAKTSVSPSTQRSQNMGNRRFIYFDPFNGISGDMVLGALVDLGVPTDHLVSELRRLGIREFSLGCRSIERQGLFGIDLRVQTGAEPESAITHSHDGESGQTHSHAHAPPSPGFTEIRRLIEGSNLDPWVKGNAVAIFRNLGEAEARVHRSTLDKVHFHEVGALDSIIDIVGSCIGFHFLGIEDFYTGPIALGQGTVTFSHGTWPVPAPATAELIKRLPAYPGPVDGELTTPTGAAILASLVTLEESPPVGHFQASGLGAGDTVRAGIPNMLRIMVGEIANSSDRRITESVDPSPDGVVLLEANLDDLDAQSMGHFMEQALSQGALDVYFTSVQMKKNRPGTLISLLCSPRDRTRFTELLFRETTTLGVRWRPMQRTVADRRSVRLSTRYGPVTAKIGSFQGRTVNVSFEFEDLRIAAAKHSVPLKSVREACTESLLDLDLDDTEG